MFAYCFSYNASIDHPLPGLLHTCWWQLPDAHIQGIPGPRVLNVNTQQAPNLHTEATLKNGKTEENRHLSTILANLLCPENISLPSVAPLVHLPDKPISTTSASVHSLAAIITFTSLSITAPILVSQPGPLAPFPTKSSSSYCTVAHPWSHFATAMSQPTQNEGAQAFEALMQQLHNTFNQLWKRIKFPDTDDELEADICILGKTYANAKLSSPEIAAAVNSRIWFTYRAGFEPIEKADTGPGPLTFARSMIFNASPNNTISGFFNTQSFLTDVGWGCMIRTSQSLLANALQTVSLGRDFEFSGSSAGLKEILALFGDNYVSPLSLHNFIQAASRLPLQVKPGEWFGPSAASLSIQRLCNSMEKSEINVYIGESGGLSDEDIKAEFTRQPVPLLLLLPVRLGINNINSIYHPSLLQLLSLKQSVGIAGGKPSSSYYFFGYQNESLLYLDPHNLQPVSDDMTTYHTSRCLTLPISELDPSMLIGLLVDDLDDYYALKASLEGTNKIVQFHNNSQRKKSSDRRDEFVKIRREADVDAIDDFVDLGDDFSDDDIVNCGDMSQSESTPSIGPDSTDSVNKYDIVERPGLN